MSKRFKDYRRFEVYTWRPNPQPLGGRAAQRPRTPTAGRRAGPDRRAARPPCSRGPADQPGPEEAQAAPQEPAPPGSAASKQPPTRPAAPSVPVPRPRRRPAAATALTSRPGRPPPVLRPNTAASTRDPSPRASAAPASRNEPCGPQPGVRRGGSCAELRAPIAPMHEGRDSRQDGARLLVRRLEGGTLRLITLAHWSEARWGGATHVGPRTAKLKPCRAGPGPPSQEVGGGRGPGFRRAAPRCSALSPSARRSPTRISSSSLHHHHHHPLRVQRRKWARRAPVTHPESSRIRR